MFDIQRVTIDWAGRPLTLGNWPHRAAGRWRGSDYGETSVLAAVVYARKAKEGQDFFPLTVNYLERYYVAGRAPVGVLQARRPSHRKEKRRPRASSSDPSAVRRRLQKRSAGHRDRAVV